MTRWVVQSNGLRADADKAVEARRVAAERYAQKQRAKIEVRDDGNKRTIRRAPLKPVKPVSDTRREQLAVYRPQRDAFLEAHPFCFRCGKRRTCLHHRMGKVGALLLDQRYWAASCAECNDLAETNTGLALAEGWLLRANSHNDPALVAAFRSAA